MAVISSFKSSSDFQKPLTFEKALLKSHPSVCLKIFSYLDRSDYKSLAVNYKWNQLGCYAVVINERNKAHKLITEVISLYQSFRFSFFQNELETLIQEGNIDALRARKYLRELKDIATVPFTELGSFMMKNLESIDLIKKLKESHPNIFSHLDQHIADYTILLSQLNDMYFRKEAITTNEACENKRDQINTIQSDFLKTKKLSSIEVIVPNKLSSIEVIAYDIKRGLCDNLSKEMYSAIKKK